MGEDGHICLGDFGLAVFMHTCERGQPRANRGRTPSAAARHGANREPSISEHRGETHGYNTPPRGAESRATDSSDDESNCLGCLQLELISYSKQEMQTKGESYGLRRSNSLARKGSVSSVGSLMSPSGPLGATGSGLEEDPSFLSPQHHSSSSPNSPGAHALLAKAASQSAMASPMSRMSTRTPGPRTPRRGTMGSDIMERESGEGGSLQLILPRGRADGMGWYKGRAGTPGYWCPEMLRRTPAGNRIKYGTGADWWSFGCLLYALMAGRYVFCLAIIVEPVSSCAMLQCRNPLTTPLP